MATVTALEAKTRLGALLNRVDPLGYRARTPMSKGLVAGSRDAGRNKAAKLCGVPTLP
jgi:hypothetical protein